MSTEPKLIAVAPMMAYTDRHCRFLHRLHSPTALLFTEMVTTGSLLHGGQWHQLDFDPAEHPVALQLGGSDPAQLAACTEQADQRGYDEINLNVGCPSPRVQRGAFGACLMREPDLVADCVNAMRAVTGKVVSVKCRLGVDDDDSAEFLYRFVDTVAAAGCTRFYVHARKALLNGLSPAQNRSVPPLHYDRVASLKARRPDLEIIVNGGITTVAQSRELLAWADGVMLGRAAYNDPTLLSACHQALADPAFTVDRHALMDAYAAYAATQLHAGERLHRLTRHALHCFAGQPGARRYRRILSDASRLARQDLRIFDEARAALGRGATQQAAVG